MSKLRIRKQDVGLILLSIYHIVFWFHHFNIPVTVTHTSDPEIVTYMYEQLYNQYLIGSVIVLVCIVLLRDNPIKNNVR